MAREVRLLLELLDRVAFGSAVALPVDMADIVAGDVFAMLDEFDRETAVGAFVIADAQPFDDGACFDAQGLSAGNDFGVEVGIHSQLWLAATRSLRSGAR